MSASTIPRICLQASVKPVDTLYLHRPPNSRKVHSMGNGLLDRIRQILLAFALAITLVVGCRQNRENPSDTKWQYPVHLGDSQAKVHQLLGNPSAASHDLVEEFPSSGLSVWLNTERQVSKLNFQGEAAVIYTFDSFAFLPSNRQVLYGLTSRSREVDFRRILGTPTSEKEEGASAVRELHCLWKKDGFLIDGLFLVAPRTRENKLFDKGSLLWFEVSPSL